jgi:hypothetical protein
MRVCVENSRIFFAKHKVPLKRETLLFVEDCYRVVYEQ